MNPEMLQVGLDLLKSLAAITADDNHEVDDRVGAAHTASDILKYVVAMSQNSTNARSLDAFTDFLTEAQKRKSDDGWKG